MHFLTDGKQKYVWLSGNGTEQLFDLENDPQELHDLAGAQTEPLKKWRKRLIKELEGREEGYSDGEHLIPGCAAKPVLDFLQGY